jgi:hypothetical protein
MRKYLWDRFITIIHNKSNPKIDINIHGRSKSISENKGVHNSLSKYKLLNDLKTKYNNIAINITTKATSTTINKYFFCVSFMVYP